MLKEAAKTRKVAAEKVLSALSVIEKAKIEPSGFLETLGGSESPGKTWMLIFTAEVDILASFVHYFESSEYVKMLIFNSFLKMQKKLKSGRYFPLTAVQRFDAAVSIIIFCPLIQYVLTLNPCFGTSA